LTTENVKIIWTDKETGIEKVMFSKDFSLVNYCRDHGAYVSEDELKEWEQKQEIKIPNQIPEGFNIARFIESIEEKLIASALESTKGNKKAAAQILGMQRTTLQEKVKRKSIETKVVSDFTSKMVKAREFYKELNGKVSRGIAGKDAI
jgi:DNA-binding NtrC family response regulator